MVKRAGDGVGDRELHFVRAEIYDALAELVRHGLAGGHGDFFLVREFARVRRHLHDQRLVGFRLVDEVGLEIHHAARNFADIVEPHDDTLLTLKQHLAAGQREQRVIGVIAFAVTPHVIFLKNLLPVSA